MGLLAVEGLGAGGGAAWPTAAGLPVAAAGCDIGYSAAAAGLSPVAGRTAYPAMLWASALVTASSAMLALRIGDSSKRRETP